ncbi:MAG: hypothetical protein A2Z88_04580 [Omnitrophica WOR_2 bacterium GWA2_47_8]|nr:MAG: hypothetical protein A2Z88_04580 [Omnitrophica WOR_2 bacterium GWA2_47_8]
MASLNKVFLIGNLTRDPELRYTPSGVAVTNLGLAVNRRFRDKSGEIKEDVCFLTVTVWDKQAEACSQHLHKGSPIFVEGVLQSRTWETTDGQKRSTIDVRAERVQFLGTFKSATGGATPATAGTPSAEESLIGTNEADAIRPEDVSWDE